jgi:hypothetical protein
LDTAGPRAVLQAKIEEEKARVLARSFDRKPAIARSTVAQLTNTFGRMIGNQ